MNIKISELYSYCEQIASDLGLSINDKFVFDLSDETTVGSIESTFKGIGDLIIPSNGRYLVLLVSNEKPDILLAIFPETEEGTLKIQFFNIKNQLKLDVSDIAGSEETDEPMTLENFEEFINSDIVETAVNDFLFSDDNENEKDIDDMKAKTNNRADDVVSIVDDEPVNEKRNSRIRGRKPVMEEVVYVVEDDEDPAAVPAEPAADIPVDPTAAAPVDPAAAPAADVPVDPAAAAPAAPVDAAPAPAAVEDPAKNVKELLAYYTQQLQQATQDENCSTEVVSGIQEIIASLVSNLEAMNKLEETKQDAAEEQAKAAAEDAGEEGTQEVTEDAPGGEEKEVEIPIDHEINLSSPAFTANVDIPADISNSLNDVELDPVEDEPQADITIEIPDAMAPVVTDAPIEPSTGAKVSSPSDDEISSELAGDKIAFGSDGNPTGDGLSDDEINSELGELDSIEVVDPSVAATKLSSVKPDAEVAPQVDASVKIEDPLAPTVFGYEDAELDQELNPDKVEFGPDGLPIAKKEISDKYIDDQIASLRKDAPEGQGMSDGSIAFVPGGNTINWSDKLYSDGAANSKDNDETVPNALKELNEYVKRVQECMNECGTCNEVTNARVKKFSSILNTAIDTWEKIQECVKENSTLCEKFNCEALNELVREEEVLKPAMEHAKEATEQSQLQQMRESADDFVKVQQYIKSIKKYL